MNGTCQCVSCGNCGGTGRIRVPSGFPYPEWDLERCDTCDGSGYVETCDACLEAEEREQ